MADRLVLCKLDSTMVGKVNVLNTVNYEAGKHDPGVPYIYQHIYRAVVFPCLLSKYATGWSTFTVEIVKSEIQKEHLTAAF